MSANAEVQDSRPASKPWVIWQCPTCRAVYADDDAGLGDTSNPPECASGEVMVPIEVVPREVAERLAEALEAVIRDGEAIGHLPRIQHAAVLAEFRAVFPKAQETE